MSSSSKVVWSEGMFLRPQHFQQQERYLEAMIDGRSRALAPFGWGFTECVIDRNALALGRLALERASGVLPDGTPFSLPDQAPAPTPLDVSDEWRNTLISLALPLRTPGTREIDREAGPGRQGRYQVEVSEVRDYAGGSDSSVALELGEPGLRLLGPADDSAAFATLGVARVVERRADNQIILDEQYIPPLLNHHASTVLHGFVGELRGLLAQRAEALAARVSGQAGSAEIADFLMLQVVNRFEPLVCHLGAITPLHPERLFALCVSLAGELATFTRRDKRAETFPDYRQDDLQRTFAPVILALRQALSAVLEQNAIALPLQDRGYGVHVSPIQDRALLGTASFILAVRAEVPGETLRSRFPVTVKIGPVENIRDLVNRQLPGIGLSGLPVAPRQLPYQSGTVYFELAPSGDLWKQLTRSGGFAFHVPGQLFPGLEMQFWAIRSRPHG